MTLSNIHDDLHIQLLMALAAVKRHDYCDALNAMKDADLRAAYLWSKKGRAPGSGATGGK